MTRVGRVFEEVLAGRQQAGELPRLLARAAPQGLTEGSLYVPQNYLTLPILQ